MAHACKIIDLSVLFIALFTDFGVLFAAGSAAANKLVRPAPPSGEETEENV